MAGALSRLALRCFDDAVRLALVLSALRRRAWALFLRVLPIKRVLGWWIVIEFVFYIYYKNHRRTLNAYSKGPPFPKSLRQAYISRLRRAMYHLVEPLAGEEKLPIEEQKRVLRQRANEMYLSGWFKDAAFHEIRRENVRYFMSAGLFNTTPNLLDAEQAAEIDQHVRVMEMETGYTFPQGFNRAVKPVTLNLEPLSSVHRPFACYVVGYAVDRVSRAVLRLLGFTRGQVGAQYFWFRPSPGSDKHPVVFTHGLGQGLAFYLHMIAQVRDRPVFLVEFPYVSMRIWEIFPSARETVDAVSTMLYLHGFSKACFMGHSFGTYCVTWCVKYRPDLVESVLLLDPVCMLIFHPKTATSMFKPKPLLFKLIHTMVFRELGISRFMHRCFWWYESGLWLEDLRGHEGGLEEGADAKQGGPRPVKAAVVLGENDMFLSAPTTRRYIEAHNEDMRRVYGLNGEGAQRAQVDVLYFPRFGHGEFLWRYSAMRKILNTLADL